MKENHLEQTQFVQPAKERFFRRHRTRVVALLFWILVLGAYFIYSSQNDLTASESLRVIANFLTEGVAGPLVYILLYMIRPLLFFPSTLITLLGGFVFGPIGILYTIVAGNASALVAYGVGRYFGQGVLAEEGSASLIQRYTRRMRQNSFETVLIMRLIFLPYDLVNYAAGFLRINWQAFILATAVGSIPATISVVLLGGSFGTLDELVTGDIQIKPFTLLISVLLIFVSIGLSRFIKRRESVASEK